MPSTGQATADRRQAGRGAMHLPSRPEALACRRMAWFDRISFFLFVSALAASAMRVGLDPSWAVLPALLLGWFVADAGSGLSHIWLDYHPCAPGRGLADLYHFRGNRSEEAYERRYREVMAGMPVVQRILFFNKSHHPRPNKLARQPMLHAIRPAMVAGGLGFALALAVAAHAADLPGWLVAGLAAANAGSVLSQHIHALAHRAAVPAPVRWLRAAGLLLSPRRHAQHHATYDRRFCMVNGWADPLVDGVFRLALRRRWLDPAGLVPA
jgi:hypothetical protein